MPHVRAGGGVALLYGDRARMRPERATRIIASRPCGPIMRRAQARDRARFRQQRANLAARRSPFHAPDELGETLILRRTPRARQMRTHPLAQPHASAHIKRHAVVAIKYVDAAAWRNLLDRVFIDIAREAKASPHLLDVQLQRVGGMRAVKVLPELPEQIGVGQCAMPGRWHERMPFDKRVESVPAFARIDSPRQ